MAQTDGYITDSQGGDWKTSNTGGSGRGDVTDVEGNAYIRTSNGSQPGVKVLVDGSVAAGPSIDFSNADGLLQGAGAADGERPFIVWAGVSPMSLSEGLIVWNQPIVLLDKSKVGFDIVTVVGRLMVVKLTGPVAIDGSDSEQVTISAGAVGYYKDSEEGACPAAEGEEGGGEAQPDPGQGEQGDTPADEAAAQPDQSIFCDMCNPDAQCGDFEGSKAGFVVNNELGPFDLKCTHTFSLTACKTCGGQADAKVWMVAMDIFASTMPLEVYSIDALIEYNTDTVGSYSYEDATFPAVLKEDTDCCPDSPPSALIIGTAGPPVEVSAEWNGDMPGYEGQPCKYIVNPCGTYCSSPADELRPDDVDCIVAEDIIKPVQRSCPVSFFEPWIVTTTSIFIPTTTQTVEISAVVSCVAGPIELLADLVTEVVTFPTAVFTGQLSLPGFAQQITVTFPIPFTGTQYVVTDCAIAEQSAIATLYPSVTQVVTDGQEGDADVLTGLVWGPPLTPLTSVTAYTSSINLVTTCAVFDNDGATIRLLNDPAIEWLYPLLPEFESNYYEDIQYYDAVGEPDVLTVVTQCLPGTFTVTQPNGTQRITYVDGQVAAKFIPVIATQVRDLVTDAEVAILTLPLAPPGGGDLVTQVDRQTITFVNLLDGEGFDVLTGTGFRAWGPEGDLFETKNVVQTLNENYNQTIWGAASDGYYVGDPVYGSCTALTSVSALTGEVFIPGGGANLDWFSTDIVVCDGGAEVTVYVITHITNLGGGSEGGGATVTLVTAVQAWQTVCPVLKTLPILEFNEHTVLNITPDYENVVYDILSVQAIPDGRVTGLVQVGSATATLVNQVFGAPIDLQTVTAATAIGQAAVTLAIQQGSEQVFVFDGLPTRPQIDVVTATNVQVLNVVTSCLVHELDKHTEEFVHRLSLPGINSFPFILGNTDQIFELPQIVTACVGGQVDLITAIGQFDGGPISEVNAVKDTNLEFLTGLWKGDIEFIKSGDTVNLTAVTTCFTGPVTVVTDVSELKLTLVSPTTGTVITLVTQVLNGVVSMIKDFDITTVTVVTSCVRDTYTITLPDNYGYVDLIIEADEGITLITETEPTCDAAYKFLNHPGILKWNEAHQTTEDCCDVKPQWTCSSEEKDHPDEENCEWFLTLVANYVKNEGLGNAEECPCYDCTSEPDCAEGSNDIQDLGSSAPTPCVARFRRMNRRFCVQCRPQ